MRRILCDDQKLGLSFVKLKAGGECDPRWLGFLYQHPCSLSFNPVATVTMKCLQIAYSLHASRHIGITVD